MRERRRCQRFIARRWGDVCFWVVIDGARQPLNDLSVEGFSVAASAAPPEAHDFAFALQLDGIPDEIRGFARTMNFVPGAEGESVGQLGCSFLSFDADGAARLLEWLTVHVITTASVRISEKDAAAIVTGPSLI
jgi:hypothetical protein